MRKRGSVFEFFSFHTHFPEVFASSLALFKSTLCAFQIFNFLDTQFNEILSLSAIAC